MASETPISLTIGGIVTAIVGLLLFCVVLAPVIVDVAGDAGHLAPMLYLIGTVVVIGVILAVYSWICTDNMDRR